MCFWQKRLYHGPLSSGLPKLALNPGCQVHDSPLGLFMLSMSLTDLFSSMSRPPVVLCR